VVCAVHATVPRRPDAGLVPAAMAARTTHLDCRRQCDGVAVAVTQCRSLASDPRAAAPNH